MRLDTRLEGKESMESRLSDPALGHQEARGSQVSLGRRVVCLDWFSMKKEVIRILSAHSGTRHCPVGHYLGSSRVHPDMPCIRFVP